MTNCSVSSELPSLTINHSKSSLVCLHRLSYVRVIVCALLYAGVNMVNVFINQNDKSNIRTVNAVCAIKMSATLLLLFSSKTLKLRRGYAKTIGYINQDRYANLLLNEARIIMIQKELHKM